MEVEPHDCLTQDWDDLTTLKTASLPCLKQAHVAPGVNPDAPTALTGPGNDCPCLPPPALSRPLSV